MGMEIPGDCAEKFTPKKLLGEGGFGRVYLAEQKGLERLVALKVLHAETLHDEVQKQRFVEEGRIAAQLSHPNVVRVIDAGAATGVPWLVYELVDGPNLRDKASRAPLTWREAIDAACSVASALEEAHRHEIFHRDVKAENVLQAASGEYKLADFGIAKWTQGPGVKTRTGFVVGTPTHLAPELIRGLSPSAASDVYALGVLLYELLTGRLPFDDANLGRLMQSHLERPVPTPTRFQPDLPDDLNRILKHALEKEPGERFGTARELREALERVKVREDSGTYRRRVIQAADHEAAAAGLAPRTGRATRSARVAAPPPPPRSRAPLAAATLALFVLIGAGAFVLRPKPVPSPPPSATASPVFKLNRVARLNTALAQTITELGLKAEALRRERKNEQIVPDFTRNTPVLVPLISRGLDEFEALTRDLEDDHADGLVWLFMASIFEDLVRVLRDDPRGMQRALGSRVDDVLKRARALPRNDITQAYANQISAVISFARDERQSHARLAAAYAHGLEVIKRHPAGDETIDLHIALRLRHLYAAQRYLFELRARASKSLEPLVQPVREMFAATRDALPRLVGPDVPVIVRTLSFHALRAPVEARPLLAAGLLTREELAAAVRDTVALVALASPEAPGQHVVEALAAMRSMIATEKLEIAPFRAPWEPR